MAFPSELALPSLLLWLRLSRSHIFHNSFLMDELRCIFYVFYNSCHKQVIFTISVGWRCKTKPLLRFPFISKAANISEDRSPPIRIDSDKLNLSQTGFFILTHISALSLNFFIWTNWSLFLMMLILVPP